MLNVVIFAMIAAFLALRLYSVLGKRTGHEPSMRQPLEPVASPLAPETLPEPRIVEAEELDAASQDVRDGLRKMAALDARFNPADFLDGARQAYKLILEAYWQGDVATIRQFANDEVASFFEETIKGRVQAGEVCENRLIRLDTARISKAEIVDDQSRLEVAFTADIAAVTRDKDGKVIAGSLTDAITTQDVWTFERPAKSRDPNWLLIDTDDSDA